MNSFDYPDYSRQESWGGNAPPVRARRSPSFYILMGCGAFLFLCCLLCVCWVAGSFFFIRQPTVLTSAWVSYVNFGYYGFAETLTCVNSQAADYTRELADQGAKFPNFDSRQATDDGDIVTVSTEIEIEGETQPWVATFSVIEGGQVGRCIETIEVQEE